jgi:hypothetical protein
MLPAHQRFETNRLARVKSDDRLVVKSELASFDYAAQVGLALQAPNNVRAKARLEHTET